MTTDDPLWYKDSLIYQVHVRAFHDSDGDGYGDFRGLTRRLDYLEDLGVTALWVMPFYPSPLRDDGYDIADYTNVHPQYGTIADFKELLTEAHRRGLRVITELVVNHTSDQHPWFQRARRAPKGSPERDFYVWSDDPTKYAGTRIIFKDFEPSNWTLDPVAGQYFWHRFYHHQPDLNFDNPAVWDALFPVLDFWMDMGVDGMRLDAIPYLYEREGTNCENLPETHAFLKALRRHMDAKYPGRMFLAEANQWPEDAVAYFGDGDECNMAFHFPVMPRLFMALHQEDRFPILDILEQTPPIPDNCQWCMFLRNHDELTLEMVTDEERDYMYRAYAEDRTARINLGIRHRLAPLLKNDRRRIELMNGLLFAMPGTPVVYYGDEIGMGDNIYLGDRNGVRTPMQWSSDRNAGFSRANPQRLFLPIIIDPEYHYEAVNVEAQQNNASSLLWWMKRLIALRKRFRAFGRGTIEFLRPANPKILAFVREYRDERILVVANLSRFVQFAELDLRKFAGVVPEELFGRTTFPRVGELPYLLTLGPHGFYWFNLPAAEPVIVQGMSGERDARALAAALPQLPGGRPLDERFQPGAWDDLEALLPDYLYRRGVGPAGVAVTAARVKTAFPLRVGSVDLFFLLVNAEFREGMPETVTVPLALVPEDELGNLLSPVDVCGLARVVGPETGVLCHAMAVPECCRAVLRAILDGVTFRVGDEELAAVPVAGAAAPPPTADAPITVRRSERNNTSVEFGEQYILKTFRRAEDGANPDLELGRYLTRHPTYSGAAAVAGFVEYRRRGATPATLAVLHEFVPNQGTAWQYTLDHLSGYFERVAALSREQRPVPPPNLPLTGNGDHGPDEWTDLLGGYLETARQLGRRTAELHLALAGNRGNPAFTPEPFDKLFQRSTYQTMRNQAGKVAYHLARELPRLPAEVRDLAERVIGLRDELMRRFRAALDPAIGGLRFRVHGDFHLGQLLYTGKDFVVIDFEGEAQRTIEDRRLKRSPLRDVAGMIRSFDYAARSVMLGLASRRGSAPGVIRPEDRPTLEPWADAWVNRVAREYVAAYLAAAEPGGFLPEGPEARRTMLELFTLEKAVREVENELATRPAWVEIPLRAIVRLCDRFRRTSEPEG